MKKKYFFGIVRGLTLAEIIVSILFVGITFVTIVSVIVFGLKSVQKSKNYTIASTLAQSKLEQIKSVDYDNIIDGTAPADNQIVGDFTIDVSVSEITYGTSGNPNAKYKHVIVEVFNTKGSKDKSAHVKLESIYIKD